MKSRSWLTLLAVFALAPMATAQNPLAQIEVPPQSARQALLEMLFAHYSAPFFAHLPERARKLAQTDSSILPLREISEVIEPLQWPGRNVETFDTGPVLLRSEDSYSHQMFEVSVESETDGLHEDRLELSLHLYHGGKPHPLPFLPNAVVTMKSENDIWRLDDIAVSVRLPLGDQDFLDSLAPERRPSALEEIESTALTRLRVLNSAQVSYAASFPELGFACSIATLGGEGEPTSDAAVLIDPELSSGKLGGYIFSIETCSGIPVDAFSITAVPEDRQTGLRAFCSDESGMIHFSEDGNGNTCLSDRQPVP